MSFLSLDHDGSVGMWFAAHFRIEIVRNCRAQCISFAVGFCTDDDYYCYYFSETTS